MRSIVVGVAGGSILALAVLFFWSRADDARDAHHCCDAHAAPHATTIAATDSTLDGASLYQIDGAFTDQDGHAFALSSLRGSPVLVALFYASCTTVCPLIVSELQRIEAALPETDRAGVRVLLVTFDAERDTPERLRAFAAERGIPTPRWTLVRADDASVRELAMALGVQYRRIAGGDFVHSALVTLLDREGRIATQLDGVEARIDPLVARLRDLLATPASGSPIPSSADDVRPTADTASVVR